MGWFGRVDMSIQRTKNIKAKYRKNSTVETNKQKRANTNNKEIDVKKDKLGNNLPEIKKMTI